MIFKKFIRYLYLVPISLHTYDTYSKRELSILLQHFDQNHDHQTMNYICLILIWIELSILLQQFRSISPYSIDHMHGPGHLIPLPTLHLYTKFHNTITHIYEMLSYFSLSTSQGCKNFKHYLCKTNIILIYSYFVSFCIQL